jgi:hypothetical protein
LDISPQPEVVAPDVVVIVDEVVVPVAFRTPQNLNLLSKNPVVAKPPSAVGRKPVTVTSPVP